MCEYYNKDKRPELGAKVLVHGTASRVKVNGQLTWGAKSMRKPRTAIYTGYRLTSDGRLGFSADTDETEFTTYVGKCYFNVGQVVFGERSNPVKVFFTQMSVIE